jgi:hypothetical protein
MWRCEAMCSLGHAGCRDHRPGVPARAAANTSRHAHAGWLWTGNMQAQE